MTAHPPRFLGFLIALTLAVASLQAQAMEPFVADYQARYMGMQADGTMTLARQGDRHWIYSLDIKNRLATLSQKTTFDEHDGHLRPLSSIDSTVLLIKKRDVQTTYDWNSRQATWSGDVRPERRGPVELQPGDLDGLLINLAIVRDLAAGKPLDYRMVDNGRAKSLTYQVVGKETITVEGKSYEATKVQRSSGDKEQIAWIVSSLPVPIRILQREDGKDTIDLTIRSLR